MPPGGHVVYLTAEKLMMGDYLPYLQKKGPLLSVCDQEHQIVLTGTSFCKVLKRVNQMHPTSLETPMYTCTATATPSNIGHRSAAARNLQNISLP